VRGGHHLPDPGADLGQRKPQRLDIGAGDWDIGGRIVLLILFLLTERSAGEPILPLDLFRNPIFSVGAALALLQSMVLLGLALYLPLFFQGVLGVSPTSAGLVMTPFSISMVIGAMLGGMAISRLKRYRIIGVVAALLMSVGAFVIARMSATSTIPAAIGFMVLTGLGTGVFFSLPMVAVQNALPAGRLGVGTAALRYLGQVGATLGIAIVGAAVASAAPSDLMRHLPTNAADKLALTSALQYGFLAVFVFALVALIATFFLNDQLITAAQPDADFGQASVGAALGEG